MAELSREAHSSHEGKPNLTVPVPRMNGQPDLSGVWQAERDFAGETSQLQVDLNDVTKHWVNVFWGLKPEEEPLQPAAAAIYRQRRGHLDPPAQCLPAGLPGSLFILYLKIIQAPGLTVMLSETGDPARQIHTEGRTLPRDPQPAWMGYSVGAWDGDTLAVETVGLKEESWLDVMGHPRSGSMHIRERYRRRDFGHMDLEITLEDPKYYTRPIVIKTRLNLIPDSDVLENVCNENEKDREHIRNAGNPRPE